MDGRVKIGFTISKEAMEAVKKGEAVIDSGGVRLLDGTMKEMARPALKSFSRQLAEGIGNSPLMSVGTLASSLANNAQSAVIQHGVNKLNKKADLTLEKLDQLQKSVDALKNSQMLSWANCALGVANLGVSIAGFYMVLKKLDGISTMVKTINDKIDSMQQRTYAENFDRYRMQIKSDIDLLQRLGINVDIGILNQISTDINKIKAYLQSVVNDFQQDKIDPVFGCNIIFSLTPAYAGLVKEYITRYYYLYKKTFPPTYEDDWLSLLFLINSEKFKEKVKSVMQYDTRFVELPHVDRMLAYRAATVSVAQQIGNLEFNRLLIEQVPKDQYLTMDKWVEERLKNGVYIEEGDYVMVQIL